MSIRNLSEMCRAYYRENPDHIVLHNDFEDLLKDLISRNGLPRDDRYDSFRLKYGPILLPYSETTNFIGDVVGIMLERDTFMNIETFDVTGDEVPHYDLLEVLNVIQHTLERYDSKRKAGELHHDMWCGSSS